MTTRRTFLAAGASLAPAASVSLVAAAPHPDAELLATCAAFDELERAYRAIDFDCEFGSPADLAGEAEGERIYAEQSPLVARMAELRATTIDGQRARARSLARWVPELMRDFDGDTVQRLTHAILRDLIG